MTSIPQKTKENSLYLTIKQVYFDAILDVAKKKEFRQISPNTLRRYIENEKVGDDIQLFYNPDLLSEDKLEEYVNDYMYYNDGVFPYIPKDIWCLDLAASYKKIETQ